MNRKEQGTSPRRILLAQDRPTSYGALGTGPWHHSTTARCQTASTESLTARHRERRENLSFLRASYYGSFSEKIRVLQKHHPFLQRLLDASWKLAGLLVVCLALSLYRINTDDTPYIEPEWKWDHNVYNPRQSGGNFTHGVAPPNPSRSSGRNLLLAQFSGSPTLDHMASISSRPNRAYARQWVRDYVRYTGSSSKRIERSCFDKVYVLNAVLARQAHPLWTPSPHTQYDVIVLLPPDAIITDLDYDLLDMFPADKLLGIATYDPSNSVEGGRFSEIVFFNLRHEYAVDTAELWYSLTEPPVTCGAGNDIQLLLDAVAAVVDDEEERNDLVAHLALSQSGFLRDRSVKIIPQNVPSCKAISLVANAVETNTELQTTSDSVCYRYWPRCDVI